jgi:hypothetical protein
MKPRRNPLVAVVALLVPALASACQSNTNDNFENPPPPPPSTCAVDAAVADCAGGSVGYVCTSDRPDHGDTNLVCSDGIPGAPGTPPTTLYCCAPYGQYWSDCTVDTTIAGCVGTSFGFRCSGPESPSDADGALACDTGTASGGDTLYCCNSAVLPPTCAADTNVRCGGVSIGYSCGGSASPETADAGLACAGVASATAGVSAYCCAPR